MYTYEITAIDKRTGTQKTSHTNAFNDAIWSATHWKQAGHTKVTVYTWNETTKKYEVK